MKVVNCRVADNIADALHYEAQALGKSQYNLIADLLTEHVINGKKSEGEKEDRLATIEASTKVLQQNSRMIGEILVIFLTEKYGEEEADRILTKISERG